MAKDITIAGHHVNKYAAYGAVGVVAVGGALWWRSRSSSASSASAGTTAGGTDPNATDPATGLTYAEETAQYGSPAAAEQALSGGGAGGSGLGYGYPAGGGYGYNPAPAASTYTSNAQWAQAAEAGLTGLGYNAVTVGAAIGRYLASLPLSSQQATIVQTAVAEYGPPPVGTFAIIAAPSAPGPTDTGKAVPKSAPGSVTVSAGKTTTVSWSAVTGATGYEVDLTTSQGRPVHDSRVDQTHAVYDGMAPGKYTVKVRAANSSGAGPWSASHSFEIAAAAKK